MDGRVVVIIGAGLIGQQWSMLFASAKLKVIVYEISLKQIDDAKLEISNKLEKFISENISRTSESCQTQFLRVTFTNVFNELPKNADFVMECVPETLEMKTKIFATMDSYFHDDTVRMSSSSYMPVSKFTSNLKNRQKCIIAHPVNPPYFLRLVEIVPAPYTDQSTIDKVKLLMTEIGQVSIKLKKEVDGFVVNRVQAAVYNSLFSLIKNDIVDVNDVDKILTEGLAPRWAFYGPLQVSVLNGPGVQNYFSKYLASLDQVNECQGYLPQHNEGVIGTIIDRMGKCDAGIIAKINEERDLNLGQVLMMKMDKK